MWHSCAACSFWWFGPTAATMPQICLWLQTSAGCSFSGSGLCCCTSRFIGTAKRRTNAPHKLRAECRAAAKPIELPAWNSRSAAPAFLPQLLLALVQTAAYHYKKASGPNHSIWAAGRLSTAQYSGAKPLLRSLSEFSQNYGWLKQARRSP